MLDTHEQIMYDLFYDAFAGVAVSFLLARPKLFIVEQRIVLSDKSLCMLIKYMCKCGNALAHSLFFVFQFMLVLFEIFSRRKHFAAFDENITLCGYRFEYRSVGPNIYWSPVNFTLLSDFKSWETRLI